MSRTKMLLLCVLLSMPLHAFGLNQVKPKAELVHRIERGAGYDATVEASLDLVARIVQPDDLAVLRLCSKDPFPLALFTNAISPTMVVGEVLASKPAVKLENIRFLRAEDCLSSYPLAGAGELWSIPRGESLPSHVESVNYCQIRVEASPTSLNSSNYQRKLEELASTLRKNPQLNVVILGNYFERPPNKLKQRLALARRVFGSHQLPKNQYYIRLQLWTGDSPGSGRVPELQYPNIFITEISKECKPR